MVHGVTSMVPAAAVMEPLPVRRRLTVLRDGSTEAVDLVFCDPSRHSVPLSRCRACRFGGDVVRDASGRPVTIGCSRVSLPSIGHALDGERLQGTEVTRLAAMLPVGLSLVRPSVCVSRDAPMRVALCAPAIESNVYRIAVVDDQQRFIGMLARTNAGFARAHSSDAPVGAHVIEPGSVHEGGSLGAAFGTMASTHARELVVLGQGRTFSGVVRDVDALRFVAHVSRTGLRPPLDETG